MLFLFLSFLFLVHFQYFYIIYIIYIMYVYIYIYIYIYTYTITKTICPLGTTCNRTSCAQVHGLPQSHCGDNREGTLVSWLHIYYIYLTFVWFEHSVCCGSLMTTYTYMASKKIFFFNNRKQINLNRIRWANSFFERILLWEKQI